MLKKSIAILLFALAMVATAPVASADIDMPECFPCESK